MLDAIDNITATEFSIGEVEFKISKLPAMKGFDLMEAIRHEFSKASIDVDIDVSNPRKAGAELLKSVLGLDPAFVARVRTDMFKNVHYRGNGAQTFTVIYGTEDMAFKGLEPISIYEVLGRSLAVNFTDSFQEIALKLA